MEGLGFQVFKSRIGRPVLSHPLSILQAHPKNRPKQDDNQPSCCRISAAQSGDGVVNRLMGCPPLFSTNKISSHIGNVTIIFPSTTSRQLLPAWEPEKAWSKRKVDLHDSGTAVFNNLSRNHNLTYLDFELLRFLYMIFYLSEKQGSVSNGSTSSLTPSFKVQEHGNSRTSPPYSWIKMFLNPKLPFFANALKGY